MNQVVHQVAVENVVVKENHIRIEYLIQWECVLQSYRTFELFSLF